MSSDEEMPSCPSAPAPQHQMLASSETAQVWRPPDEIATNRRPPITAFGVWLPMAVPSPMPPAGLDSQQNARFSAVSPQVVLVPGATVVNCVAPATCTRCGVIWERMVSSVSTVITQVAPQQNVAPSD